MSGLFMNKEDFNKMLSEKAKETTDIDKQAEIAKQKAAEKAPATESQKSLMADKMVDTIPSTNESIATAKPGDKIKRKDGTIVTLSQGDIDYASKQLLKPADTAPANTAPAATVDTSTSTTDSTATPTDKTQTEPAKDINGAIGAVDKTTADNPTAAAGAAAITNDDGSVDTKKAQNQISEYENKLVELGAGHIDKNGNFVLDEVKSNKTAKILTALSCVLSMVAIASGVPLFPINFKALTGADAADAQKRALQQQYMNMKNAGAATVENMNADVESGKIAENNAAALTAQEKHANATAAQKDVIKAQKEATMDINSQAFKDELLKMQTEESNNEKIMTLQHAHAKEMTQLQTDLSTKSAKALTEYSKAGWLIDYINELKASNYSDRQIAIAISALGGQTPTQKGLENAQKLMDIAATPVNTAANALGAVGNFVKP